MNTACNLAVLLRRKTDMMKISAAIAVIISGVNFALAGAQPAEFDSLSVKVSTLKVSTEIKAPVPANPAKETGGRAQHTIRMCSYMFVYTQSGADGVGVFAFDVDSEGRVCEILTSNGQVYGGYSCYGKDTAMAPTQTGGLALLFQNHLGDGASLYHQLNVPPDFAALNKFRGTMRISGRPPKDLSKPLEPNGGGVYKLSCKMESVAFGAN
jgi:hypothetical protein